MPASIICDIWNARTKEVLRAQQLQRTHASLYVYTRNVLPPSPNRGKENFSKEKEQKGKAHAFKKVTIHCLPK